MAIFQHNPGEPVLECQMHRRKTHFLSLSLSLSI